ncbi:MAG: hypothetical protein CMF72_00260 [Mameliella sp.]|nr:hypothetical protein [Mameliella sp.]|tara:strand:+ start:550 stop:939 length:390 start_codon:yes stop_codon:yes gene_type:complete
MKAGPAVTPTLTNPRQAMMRSTAVGNVDVYGDVGDDLLAGAVVYGGEGEDTLDALASEYSPIFVDFVSGEDVITFDVTASDLALSEVTIVNSPPGATYPTTVELRVDGFVVEEVRVGGQDVLTDVVVQT